MTRVGLGRKLLFFVIKRLPYREVANFSRQ